MLPARYDDDERPYPYCIGVILFMVTEYSKEMCEFSKVKIYWLL